MTYGLYLHIPFCKKKCNYCDFTSYPNKLYLQSVYIDAIVSEMKKYSNLPAAQVDTVFFGGGTPTVLYEFHIERLVYALRENFNILPNAEFTVEANPGTLSYEKLKCLKRLGVNRLSFGLQSDNTYHLEKLGRIHSFSDFCKNYSMARTIGFDNINVDLIFGIPEQTLEQWERTLNEVIKLEPDHISCYGLTIEKNTPFYSMDLNLPTEIEERSMYHAAISVLKSHGYNQYEISNFTKEKPCWHNIKYWKSQPYIGLGVSAASFIDGKRISNTKNLLTYVKGDYLAETETLTVNDIMGEYMFLRLRLTEGVDLDEFYQLFGKQVFQVYNLEKYINNGFLQEKNMRLSLTEQGIDISNQIFQEFV